MAEGKKRTALDIIQNYDGPKIRIMEVCGTHTHEIFRLGIRQILPKQVDVISGPGCPVCVTPVGYIDQALWLALEKGVTICTFGDLISRQKAGKAFLTLEEGALILPPCRVTPDCDHLAALAQDGRLLVFPLEQMKRLSGGKGVQIIGLKGEESLKSVLAINGSVVRVSGVFRNKPREILSDEKHLGSRARRGAIAGLVNQPVLGKAGVSG